MEKWRRKADEFFPELAAKFAEEEALFNYRDEATGEEPDPIGFNSYQLWFLLRDAFENAYDDVPRNESLIQRIYQYADWCCSQPRGQTAANDLLTCVAVCFYEHIPEHPKARADMPRWWCVEDLAGERNILAYNLSPEEFEDLRRYLYKERHQYNPKLKRWRKSR